MADTETHLSGNDELFVQHARTYHRFTMLVKWSLITLAAVITFLTLYTATNASFVGALVVGLVIFGLGAYAMRHGLAHSSEEGSAPAELRGRLDQLEGAEPG
jgi:hypothetical protein